MRTEGISKDPTGNRTGNLSSCGVVPQPTAPPLADKPGMGWKEISDCGMSSSYCVHDISRYSLRLTCQIINVTCRVKKAFHLEFGRYQVVTKTGDHQACSIIMQYILFSTSHPWNNLLYNGYRVFPGGRKRPGRDADPSPLLVPRYKNRVQLYPYSP